MESMNYQMLVKAKERGFAAILNGRICGYSTLKEEPIEFLLQLAHNMSKRFPERQYLIVIHSVSSARTEKNYLIIETTGSWMIGKLTL